MIRMSLDVAANGVVEIVSLRLDAANLGWSCSCGLSQCVHAARALRLLAEGAPGAEESRSLMPFSSLSPPSASTPPPPGRADARRTADLSGLAESLEDVVTAVVRTGLVAKEAPSVYESLERLVGAAPEPLPVGVSRWIGRMRWELARHDLDGVSRMLDGASRLVEDLRAGAEEPLAQSRLTTWLGQGAPLEQLSDRVMVELGRELLDGAERMQIERRYLLDLDNGELYREEGLRGQQDISLGTCPRLVQVGLAAVARGAAPPVLRLLQYSSSPVVQQAHWQTVGRYAVRCYEELPDFYRAALQDFPSLAEPTVCVGAAGLATVDGQLFLLDGQGDRLPLISGVQPTTLAYLEQRLLDPKGKPDMVLGRLQDRDATLYLRPLAATVAVDGLLQHFIL